MVVRGPVAGALGDLARDRWQRATGETLMPPPRDDPIWPQSISPTFEDIEVAIARTAPGYTDDHQPVHEIEALYLDAIAAARRTIYCESQYFASRKIGEALTRRLREPDGPEIVIVNPESADGYLEAAVMDTARAKLLAMVHEADRYGRFRIYTPVTQKRRPIYVHAKILIVDDVLLRVGSSNLNNRSLGFDTECDLVMEAAAQGPASKDFSARVRAILYDLLTEHLDVDADAFAAALEDTGGSLIRAIEGLMGEGRSLAPYDPDEPAAAEEALADIDLLDPERPPSFTHKLKRLATFSWRPVR
jgi:phospholipase D1/2